MWQLYEVKDRRFQVTHQVERRKPVQLYVEQQGRFNHLTPEHIQKIQAWVDARAAEVGIPAAVPSARA
jgi:pyruvate ferredoxin oxidoreductase beta subunit/oxalate oxidoreductase subunit beta